MVSLHYFGSFSLFGTCVYIFRWKSVRCERLACNVHYNCVATKSSFQQNQFKYENQPSEQPSAQRLYGSRFAHSLHSKYIDLFRFAHYSTAMGNDGVCVRMRARLFSFYFFRFLLLFGILFVFIEVGKTVNGCL